MKADISPASVLAAGVLAPKSSAASSALATARLGWLS